MSAQSYITSGLLERQAAGLTNAEESREIEEMALKYPAIQKELDEINHALRGYVLAHQVAPPESLKDNLLKSTRDLPRESGKSNQYKQAEKARTAKDGNAFSINTSTVATILLALGLIAACFTAYSFFNEAQRIKKEVLLAEKEIQDLKKQKEDLTRIEQLLLDKLQSLRHPATIPVALRGTRLAENTLAIIYWNDILKTHLIDVKRMPEVPAEKELRLWVTVDRQPQSIGNLKPNPGDEMSGLPFIENPETYYVTLEDKGADIDRPNLRQVVMLAEFEK